MTGYRVLQIIATWQIVGGLYGAALTGHKIVSEALAGVELVIAIACSALYAFSIAAGALLWCGNHHGVGLSSVAQLLQIPQVSFRGMSFMLLAGLGPRFHFDVDLAFYGGTALDQVNTPIEGATATGLTLGINLVAVIALAILRRSWHVPLLRPEAKKELQPAPAPHPPDGQPPDTRDIDNALAGAFTFDAEAKRNGPPLDD